jgi:nicotinate-nucleotide pyrophosphorylase (carboxylating)
MRPLFISGGIFDALERSGITTVTVQTVPARKLAAVRAIAETGVDRISIGALTKDIDAIDLSMRFNY